MNTYLFSIVVTVYNKEATLRRCIDSILENNGDDYEILIINDGSTDNSLKIIEEYSSKYHHINFYNQRNIGISRIRQNITTYISGEYILFVDADDTINNDLISNLRKCIKSCKPDIIRFDINEINSIKDKKRYILNTAKVYSGRDALLDWNTYNIRYGLFGMYCFKKSIYSKCTSYFYSLDCYSDVVNIPIIIFFSNIIVVIPYIGYNYYRNKNSITNGYYPKEYKFLQFQKACDNLLEFFKNQLSEEDNLYLKIKDYYMFHLKRKKEELLQ